MFKNLIILGFILFFSCSAAQAEKYISAAYYTQPGCTGDITIYNAVNDACIVSADGETSTQTTCEGDEKIVTTYQNAFCSGENTQERTTLQACDPDFNYKPLCGEPDIGSDYATVSSYTEESCDADLVKSYTIYRTGTCYNSTGGTYSMVNCAWQENEGIAFRTYYDENCEQQIGTATVTQGGACTNNAMVTYCSSSGTVIISLGVVFASILSVVLFAL